MQELKITIPILLDEGAAMPEYKTIGAAGADLRARLSETITLKPLERRAIPTGIRIELPDGYEAQIRPRSGLALEHGITCLNTPGTIDSDYRGEIKVILVNLGSTAAAIHPGDRIAQMVISRYTKAEFSPVKVIGETDRQDGGFGSTGR
ncbi:MAG: dUTP diphosphatase [Spirochaetia bacterium]|nr:dUTP diphosphatase [Spirochaetia bacterium]